MADSQNKIFLLDANILINAKNTYFQFARVPEYWDWIIHHGKAGNIKIPIEIYEELADPHAKADDKDELSVWIERADVKAALLLIEQAEPDLVNQVLHTGYAPDLTDDELEKTGKDPFLISYGLADTGGRVIVSAETSAPKRRRGNRKVPDVCKDLNVECIDGVDLINTLNFSTGWSR